MLCHYTRLKDRFNLRDPSNFFLLFWIEFKDTSDFISVVKKIVVSDAWTDYY